MTPLVPLVLLLILVGCALQPVGAADLNKPSYPPVCWTVTKINEGKLWVPCEIDFRMVKPGEQPSCLATMEAAMKAMEPYGGV